MLVLARGMSKFVVCTLTCALVSALVFGSVGVMASDESEEIHDKSLYLFLSKAEQEKEDKKLLSSVADDTPDTSEKSVEKPTDAMADKDTVDNKKERIAQSATKRTRYRGAVMRGSELLGVWLGKERYVSLAESEKIQIDNVAPNGTIYVSVAQKRIVLNPGDYLPLQLDSDAFVSGDTEGIKP